MSDSNVQKVTEPAAGSALPPSACSTATRWRSCARWEHKHGFDNDLTTDEHDTKAQALAVCDGLRREGLGGERCHFPLDTWVEPIQAIGMIASRMSYAELAQKYNELLYAVGMKYQGEDRHDTALRYIREAEDRRGGGPVTETERSNTPISEPGFRNTEEPR